MIWDLPTRLFHWALALCVLVACSSAHRLGSAALRVHFVSGYAVLILVAFRLLWGFAGPYGARFAPFVRGPALTWRYARSLLTPSVATARREARTAGHNPLGVWSVLALLAACLVQAGSGLFSRDDVASEGPLAALASETLVDRAGALHASGEAVLYVLIGLHVAAIVFYRLVKKENLLKAMITGGKRSFADPTERCAQAPCPTDATGAGALVLLAIAAALVGYLVHLTP